MSNITEKLQELFTNSFDTNAFAQLCSEISGNNWEPVKNNEISVSSITKTYEGTISSVRPIGYMTADDVDKLHFVVIHLSTAGSVNNARTRQRDFAVKYLDYYNISAGVFAYTDNTGTWRYPL